eukprot:gnl/Spiro4/4795_TR2401_c0_g1_i1.p1 gnl/Spiro4/4795_TR2401_c0_g1~~gnl/Spiro4/4795_TR2401_c0_g1_i1.p1  ORF type:complete len:113 (-),score=6.45 gnl/Spiro4/4795_TR2401_c0_g1_i1:36-374(-)
MGAYTPVFEDAVANVLFTIEFGTPRLYSSLSCAMRSVLTTRKVLRHLDPCGDTVCVADFFSIIISIIHNNPQGKFHRNSQGKFHPNSQGNSTGILEGNSTGILKKNSTGILK